MKYKLKAFHNRVKLKLRFDEPFFLKAPTKVSHKISLFPYTIKDTFFTEIYPVSISAKSSIPSSSSKMLSCAVV